MNWLRLRTAIAVGLLAAGTTSVFLGWYQKRGYVDLVAAGARATEEAKFDNRDFERAGGNLLASRDLIAYNRGVRASAAGQFAVAARYFQEAISRSRSPALRAKAHYNLGNVFAVQGKVREAAEMFREALRLDPSDWDAKSNLETLYTRVQISEEEGTNASLKQAQDLGRAGDEMGQGSSVSGKAGI
ncbi:MAG: tetratricopeptide repeat protein [Candidatus Rokubacteria bacterium]|nr:tetratricopeptide repeat protein [Candidatus Rokubacteria bacterium]